MVNRLTIVLLLALIVSLGVPATAHAESDDRCPDGYSPAFAHGFEALHAELGEAMGDPLTCQFPDPDGSGDIHQLTTTGLAYWRQDTNTSSFTNGWERWALTDRGIVRWTGEQLDPPPPPEPEPDPAPTGTAPAERAPAAPRSGRVIVVSLSEQRLWAYQSGAVVLSTPVTTGRAEAPTPPGRFTVLVKYSPYQFRSPFPRGHRFYYEPVWSNYSLRFSWGGLHIHDAPWRPDYGPGTNTGHTGSDGQWRTGSLGCVNVPRGAMSRLYQWATVGTQVVVRW